MLALLYSIRNSVRYQLHCASSLKYAACIPAALFLAACSTISLDTPSSSPAPVVDAQNNADASQVSALRTLTAEQDRLYRVADPLLTRNVPICRGNVRNLIGFSTVNKYSFSSEDRKSTRLNYSP